MNNKDEFMQSLLYIMNPCDCDCHNPNFKGEVIHMQPCCDGKNIKKYENKKKESIN